MAQMFTMSRMAFFNVPSTPFFFGFFLLSLRSLDVLFAGFLGVCQARWTKDRSGRLLRDSATRTAAFRQKKEYINILHHKSLIFARLERYKNVKSGSFFGVFSEARGGGFDFFNFFVFLQCAARGAAYRAGLIGKTRHKEPPARGGGRRA